MRRVLVLVLLSAAACGSSSRSAPPPAAPAPVVANEPDEATVATAEAEPVGSTGYTEADAERGIAFMEEMAAIIDDNKTDCDRMGAELGRLMDENDDFIHHIRELDKDMTPEQKRAFDEKYKPRMEGVVQKMMGGLIACKDNQAVQDAFQRFE